MGSAERAVRTDADRSPYLPVFDGVRGLVILGVVMGHIMLAAMWEPSGVLLGLRRASFFSIEFLFVISGFLLFLPVLAARGVGSKRVFLLRRAARIVPAYLVSLAATVLVMQWVERPELPLPDPAALLAHLAFLQHPLRVSGFGVNEVYWTLSIIVGFYLLMPFAGNWYLRHPVAGLLCAVAIVMGWRLAFPLEDSYEFYIQFPLFVGDFAIGMTAAWAFMRLREGGAGRLRRIAALEAVASLGFLLLLMYETGRGLRVEYFYFGESTALALGVPAAFALFVVSLALAPRAVQWPLANRVSRWVGVVSYGVFLFHVLFLQLAMEYLELGRDGRLSTVLLLLAVVLPPSLLAAWLSYRFVERPVRDRTRALARGWAARAPSNEPPLPATAAVELAGAGPASASLATAQRAPVEAPEGSGTS